MNAYEENLRLGRLEYLQQHIYLRSRPRCLGLVLGNACNIYCPHCYQAKNGDNLLKPPDVGRALRREFMALYPYLATLRIQGGEAFAYAGFRELLEDVAATVQRPIVSVSTNGTLIDEEWAERIVRLPFSNLTVSIDGGTPATYARLRRGGDLDDVLANVRRIHRWKDKLGSQLPNLDSFFVVMRSNFREIPQYLQLMYDSGFSEIALQTVDINDQNSSREASLEHDEAIAEAGEIAGLHVLVRGLIPGWRRRFRKIRTSGLTSLFESQGLDCAFLQEASEGLYPDSDDLPMEASLCPNPWTTLFVAENGDVHLCFLSVPVGNLYEMPLADIWNCPSALAKRSQMISGRYLESGCSPGWCGWRQGKPAAAGASTAIGTMRQEMQDLANRAAQMHPLVEIGESDSGIAAVRRKLAARDRQIHELQAMFVELCAKNGAIHERGQQHIDNLEAQLSHIEAQERRSAADYQQLSRDYQQLSQEYQRVMRLPVLRIAGAISRRLPFG